MKKLMLITVSGKNNQYCFYFYGYTQHLETWKKEGLKIEVVENTIPNFIVQLGLTKVWCKMLDFFNFKF